MPSDWVGRELGEYFVFERLGAGSMAEVFKALQPSMDRMVGIKVLSPSLSHDPQFVARFRREAQIAASLEHPHILPVIDFGECEATLYLVMRYVNGGTLHDLIERGPLEPQVALRYLTEIGEALDYAHDRRVVHRDIKPRNVLLDEQGNPFIADFGLAKLVDTGGLTHSGIEMIGTPHYMSPEQARGQPVDGRADLYSLGVLLYQMLTGRVPFEADSTVGIVMKHISEPVPAVTLAVPQLPEALNQVVCKAMAKEPADRYQSAHELTQAVAAALGASVLSGPLVKPNEKSTRRRMAHWWGSRARTGSGLPLGRKLAILGKWARLRARGRGAHPEPLADLLAHLFPNRRQRTLLYAGGGLMLMVALLSVMGLLRGLAGAPQPTATAPTTTFTRLAPSPTARGLAVTAGAAATALNTRGPTPVSAATVQVPTDEATPVVAPRATQVLVERDLMTLVLIPAGKFLLGASANDELAEDDELPQVEIYLDAYWIDRTEVTVAQFQEFVSDTGYVTDAERGCCGGQFGRTGGVVFAPDPQHIGSSTWRLPLGSGTEPASPRQPVVMVSWNDASAYCAWAGRRLPTEAEWEKAARGPLAQLYPWGNQFDGTRLNFCDRNCTATWLARDDDAYVRQAPAGAFLSGASPYDVLDMAGNVWEWVNDYYDFRGYFRVPTANPPGPDEGETHVLRGGSWLDTAAHTRTTVRAHNLPDARNNVSGFRCAASEVP